MLLLCTLSIAVAEEPDTYTITITGDTGHTYEAYQIFTGDLAGNVLSNIVLGTGVANGILTFNGTTYGSAAELAEALTEENKIAFADHAAQHLAAVAGTSTEADGVYTISDLEPGYYLIKDKDNSVPNGDAYTKFIAKIVNDVNATPKTDKTTHEKKVYENVKQATNGKTGAAGNNYNDVADYCIGDDVPFALYSKVPDLEHFDHYTMLFHDQMSDGLTFKADSVKVTIGGVELANGTDFVVDTSCEDGCSFHVQIKELVGKNYTKGAEIRVDFNATLNANAEIGLPGNPNQSKLQFTNNPNNTGSGTDNSDLSDGSTTETPWDYVVVFTYELDVTKVDGEDNTKKLANAEFVLQNEDNEYVTVDSDGVVTGWVTAEDDATTLVSDANGLFKVIGLDDGTYTLTETKAPEGYNKLAKTIEIVVNATTINDQNYANVPANALTKLEIKVDGALADGDTDSGIVDATIENNTGATLPETGGIGTTIFYVMGGLLVLAAVVLLVTKRRVGEEN
jgi:LPXTG-motif cell wall-anchored protein